MLYITRPFLSSLILLFVFLLTPELSHAELKGHWELNENSGNVINDISGLNNSGTIFNASWFTDANGVSLNFTGNGYVEIPSSANLDVGENYSVSLWINPTSLPTWQCLFERGTSTSSRMGVWLNNDQITFETSNNGGGWWNTSSVITTDQWQHLVVVHNGTTDTETVYLNGSLIGSQAGRTTDTPNLGNLHFGSSPAYSGYYFNGKISDVRYFNNSLTEAEIFEIYSGSAPVCTDNDGDGFNAETSLCGPVDCNDDDASINSSAIEIACDGIDQDCSGQDYCPSDPDSPIAYYSLDTNAADSSGNENNGSIVGSANFVSGQIGNALSFDGSNYINVPDSSNLDLGENYSISLWTNPNNLPTWQCMVERGSSASNRMGLWLNNDQITFETSNNGGNWWNTSSTISTGQWHHIVATHEGTTDTESIYVNGTLIGSQTGRTTDTPNSGALSIGSSPAYSFGYKFNGNIDDVRIYNKVLSQTDILDLFGFTASCTDLDGDGYNAELSNCGPVDCDDSNPAINPGATEVCDGIDNNCSTTIDENLSFDIDADGFTSIGSCSGSADDCDDTNALINPAATEVCNGIDDNCTGGIDESGTDATWYADTDGDLYGNSLQFITQCSQPTGYVASDTDCNDNDPAINPSAAESCDAIDNNCDGQIDEGLTFDFDSDGFTSTFSCNGSANDCDDTNASVNPLAVEVCDGLDNNCNNSIDEGLSFDLDNDGFTSLTSCNGTANDCNDGNPSINPGATEIACDGIDQNCSGQDYCPSDPDLPLAHFNLDSDTKDASGNGNNGFIVGTATYQPGQIGNALSFSGAGHVNIPSSTTLDVGENYSVSMWINPSTLPNWQCLFERGNSSSNRMGIWLNGDKITFETSNNGGNWWTTTGAVALDQWHHIVATHDGTTDTESIYVNGTLIGTQTNRTVDTPNLGDLYLANSPAYSSSYNFQGKIDDVRLYNKTLTATDVSTLYLTCNDGDTRSCGNSNIGQCSYGTETCAGGQWGQCIDAVGPSSETCNDDIDNDCDGKTDCDDAECFDSGLCANPYQLNFIAPTPTDGSSQSANSVTVSTDLTGSDKYSFIDWNNSTQLWLTMDTDINGNIIDTSSQTRTVETKGNTSPITGRFGNAMYFDGFEDYLQIYEDIDPTQTVNKHSSNPLFNDGERFGSVWKYNQTIYLFYSNGSEILVSSSPESDGVNFTLGLRILAAGSLGEYDDVISGANVWEENGTWHMFYRLRTSDNNNGFGYASCTAGLNCVTGTATEYWNKYAGNPINSLKGLSNNDYDPYGLIKVENTYHLYANPSPRVVNHYTSTDLINWQSDANNPIFNTDRYCPYVYKYNGYFYMILPHDLQGFETSAGIAGNHRMELYRDISPTFYPWEREYLGTIMSNDQIYDQNYIDTPSCIQNSIERDSTGANSDEMKCYYTGKGDHWNQSHMTFSLSKHESLTPMPEGYLQKGARTFSAWIYLEDNQGSKTIFSIGDGRNDSNFQEVLRVNQGRTTLSWKTGKNTEDSLIANTTLPLNQWTHVSYVYDGTAFSIYVNGVSDSISAVTTPYYSKRNLYLGTGYNSTDYFRGSIDDVLIFNRALSAAEISALHSSNTNLMSQFNLLEIGTYSYKVHSVGWEGRTATSEQRQVTIAP